MKTFEEKVRAMTGKEIVMAMVNGLKKEWVKVDMSEFAMIKNGVCFGCAATNTVCEIMQQAVEADSTYEVAEYINEVNKDLVRDFEYAINWARTGNILRYNLIAREIGIQTLPIPEKELPYLTTENYKEKLNAYIEYANILE